MATTKEIIDTLAELENRRLSGRTGVRNKLIKMYEKLQAENERLKNYLKDHFIETCPDIYCGKRDEREQCEKCAEKWIQDILSES